MKQSLFLLFSLFLNTVLHAQHKVTVILKEQTHLLNDSIYISGSFNKWISKPDSQYLMLPHGMGEKVITLNLKAGKIEYKFHRGNWDKGEVHNFGAEVNNREVIINRNTTLIDSVKTWKDQIDSNAQILDVYPYMLGKQYQDVVLGDMYPWYFKQGHDATWSAKDLEMSDWQKMRPKELKAAIADKNGKIEGWFRAKVRFDTAFNALPIYFGYDSWASGEMYIDGILIKKYGEMGVNGQSFKEYNPIHKLAFLLNMSLGEVHTLAFHFIDQVSPLPPHDIKVKMSFSVVGPDGFAIFTEHVTEEPIYLTLWVVVSTLFSVLFWLLAFQNREEKNLFLIAITSTIITINAIIMGLPHNPSISFVANKISNQLSLLSISVFNAVVILLIVRLFNRKITTLLKAILALILSITIIMTIIGMFYETTLEKYSDLLNILALFVFFTPIIVCLYYIISSRKTLRGAQWAIVGGLILTWVWLILVPIYSMFAPLTYKTYSILLTGYFLSFPLGMLVYVAMRFKEIIKNVRENAQQVVQLSEEKNTILETQNETLEKQVKERTSELNNSLEKLKSTQNQLVQSEKLASLGELTAGIAHEIQNPLNFVNNFSELSLGITKDLDTEITNEPIDKDYVRELMHDLNSNQEKINHHGKRASSIVSGMIEHSKPATGVKEFTDINKLCDEYSRIAFNSFQAKDKNFNCEMITHFDETLLKTEIVPQDVGRVVFNIVNNAFYAVNERANQKRSGNFESSPNVEIGDFKPTVTIETRHALSLLEIHIKDNGTGMSENVKAKVFQPFFTTKPTGQGTGLGLSLAYDIITKGHGGKLTVESTEGKGSEFVINFPIA